MKHVAAPRYFPRIFKPFTMHNNKQRFLEIIFILLAQSSVIATTSKYTCTGNCVDGFGTKVVIHIYKNYTTDDSQVSNTREFASQVSATGTYIGGFKNGKKDGEGTFTSKKGPPKQYLLWVDSQQSLNPKLPAQASSTSETGRTTGVTALGPSLGPPETAKRASVKEIGRRT